MRSDELDYPLPPQRVATSPASPRDSARLLVVHVDRGTIEHRTVRDLPALLEPTDALVFNTTSVMPARIVARRASGGAVEGLALAPVEGEERLWRVLLRGSARLRPGERLRLESEEGSFAGDALELEARDGEAWRARFLEAGSAQPADPRRVLARSGHVPLPPYILGARRERGEAVERPEDRRWYQTVYAHGGAGRSVAAPTAGLHFTAELLEALERRGTRRIDVTLEVGPGTFKPVSAETLEAHLMHRERFEVSAAALAALRAQREAGGRVVAVGTTSVRTLESLPSPLPRPDCGPITGETDLLIAPGHAFRVVDALLTNFHLPRSTLLALVAAMVGLERLKAIYAEAIAGGYRFYSYGDAMLVLGTSRSTGSVLG